MLTPSCAKCRRTIPAEDVNVANDVAFCRNCNVAYRLSELSFDGAAAAVDLNQPPAGAWLVNDGGGTVMGASNRSLATAAGLLFAALFWNGIVSVFVAVAISGTFHVLHLPQPAWFPAPEMNGGGMGGGMVLFLWLFLTPFIAIGIFLAVTCLSALFGRTEVRVSGAQGTVFTGVGTLGWRRRFDAAQVTDVRMQRTRTNEGNDRLAVLIQTRDGKQVKLGTMLSAARRQFMLAALQQRLLR